MRPYRHRLHKLPRVVEQVCSKIGQTVEHAKWGKGTIIDINRSAVGMEATIHFPDAGGDKRLDLTLAPLTPVA